MTLPTKNRRRAQVGLGFLAAVYAVLFATHQLAFAAYRIDLDVYRIGSRVWLSGGELYGPLPKTSAGLGLPFTYPPVAAVLLTPLSLIPYVAASLVLTLASLAALVLVVRVVLESTGVREIGWVASHLSGWRLPLVVVAVAVPLEPIRQTLGFGQVNLLLLALVVADCLVDQPWWPRGALVGLAAGIKLTPAVFVLFLLLRFGRRAAVRAVVSAALVTLLGLVLAAHDSVAYWTTVVFETGRIGGIDYAGNQSLQGVLSRAGLAGGPRTLLWVLLSGLIVVVTAVGMRRSLRAGWPALALGLNAMAGLLISPISWSHHWVWFVPLVLALGVAGVRGRDRLLVRLAIGGLLLAAVSPQWWFRHGGDRELGWSWIEQGIASAYVGYALIVLVALAVVRSRAPRLQSESIALMPVEPEAPSWLVPRGSMNRTRVPGAALGRCETPRGTV